MNPYMAQAIGQTLQQELARRGSAGIRQQQMNIIGLDAERKKAAEILADSQFKREMLAQKFKDEQEKLQAEQLIRDAQDAMRAKAIRGLSKAPVSEDGGAGVPGIPSESDLADAGKLFEALGPERAQAFIDRLNVAKPDEIDNIYKEIQAAAVDSLKAQDARKQLEAMLAPGSPAIPGQPAIPDVMGFRGRWETGGELTERPAGMIGPPMTAPERYVKQAGSPEVPGVPEVPPGEYRRILGDSVELLRPEIDADPVKALGTIRSAAFAEQTRQRGNEKVKPYMVDEVLPDGRTKRGMMLMTQSDLDSAYRNGLNPVEVDVDSGFTEVPFDSSPQFDKNGNQLPPRLPGPGQIRGGVGGTSPPFPIISTGAPQKTPDQIREEAGATKDQTEAERLAGVAAQILNDYGDPKKRLDTALALMANPTKVALLAPDTVERIKARIPMLQKKIEELKATKPGTKLNPARFNEYDKLKQEEMEIQDAIRVAVEKEKSPEWKKSKADFLRNNPGKEFPPPKVRIGKKRMTIEKAKNAMNALRRKANALYKNHKAEIDAYMTDTGNGVKVKAVDTDPVDAWLEALP